MAVPHGGAPGHRRRHLLSGLTRLPHRKDHHDHHDDGQPFQEDLKHPGSGAFTAFIPAVGVLLSAHYTQLWPDVGRWVTIAFVVALFVIAAQLFAMWFSTGIEASSLNSGFYVPIIAGPFIASLGLTTVGFAQAGLVVMGAGLFFWITFGTIVMNRHITGSRETHAVSPTLSAFLAAPATGGVGWIFIATIGVASVVLIVRSSRRKRIAARRR